MKQKTSIIIGCLQLCIITNMACAMDPTSPRLCRDTNHAISPRSSLGVAGAPEEQRRMDQPKEYSTKLSNITKALILIEAIECGGRNQNITVKPSRSEKLKIKATVLSKDVEEQEKYYTEEPFFPFFVHQAPDKVTIKPYFPGNYTVYLPAGSQFSASTPHGVIEIHEQVKAWNTAKN